MSPLDMRFVAFAQMKMEKINIVTSPLWQAHNG